MITTNNEWSSRTGIFAGKLNTIANASRVDIPLVTTAKYSRVILYPLIGANSYSLKVLHGVSHVESDRLSSAH